MDVEFCQRLSLHLYLERGVLTPKLLEHPLVNLLPIMSHSKLSEIPHLCSPNKASHPSWETNQRNTQLLLVKNVCTNELKVTLKKQMLTHGDVWINLSCLIWLDRPKPSMCLVAQLCLTLCDSMDCSPPGSSVRGDSPGDNTGVGCHALFQGIFLGLNPVLPHCRWILYRLSHQGTQLVPVDKKEIDQLLKNLISSADGIGPYFDSLR